MICAQGDGGAGGGVELGDVVGFGDGEAVAFQFGQIGGEAEELLHAHGEVGSVEQRAALLRLGPHLLQVRVPAGGADDDAAAQSQHGAHVLDRGLGSREVDDHVHAGQVGRGERGGVLVLGDVERADAVAALAGDLGGQAAGLSLA